MKHLNIFQLISGIRRTILCVALCLFAGAYGATEYFVDINRTNDTGDGKSEATAFKTIQAALNAAVSGDTITVLPGEYKESPVEVEDLEEQGKSSKTRLYITKRITLRSKEGASKTHIVGAYDPDSDLGGMGPNAVRCITVRNGIGAVIKGFTIRDGAANATLNDKGDKGRTRSGGVSSRAHINSPDYQAVASSFTLVDCVI